MSSSKWWGSCRLAAQFVVLSAVLALAGLAFAQSTAKVMGTVTDPQGAVVPNAKVTLTNVDKGTVRTTQTENTGLYQIPSLPVGKYDLTIEAPGLAKYEAKGLILEVARTLTIDAKLAIATALQQVTVTTETPMIEESTMTVGQVINQRTVQEIPLNGRHFVDLGLLVAGTVTPPTSGFLTAPLRGQGSFQFNTAGNREDTVNFMINGVNLNDMAQNQITFQPSINTVQEFKVDNSTYSAEYGRNSGAIVNIATRSGSNDFHGEAFEFVRNNAMDARNFFNPTTVPQSPFKRNNFGGDVGGPIIKNKLFFYGSYEGLRQRQGLTINGRVLSDNERAQVTDPTSQQLLQFIPKQNSASFTNGAGEADGFVGSASANVNIDQWTGDIQYTISDKDSLHGYYAFQRDQRQEPTLQGDTIPGFGDTRASHRQILTLNETHIFNSDVVNEARLGFNRLHITFTPNNQTDPTTLGINAGTSGNIGLPFITIQDIGLSFGGPNGFPQGRGDATGIVSDTVSWLHGKHSFKFGGEFRRFSNNNFLEDTGLFNFTTLNSGGNPAACIAPVSCFITGEASRFAVTTGNRPSRIYAGALGFFAMDTIKLTRNLTLEAGLRWDWNMSPTEAQNRFIAFDTATSQLNPVNPGYQQNAHNFQPRLGFAWDVFGNGHSVVRGGYGLMTEQPVANAVSGLASNPPLAASVNFNGPSTWANAFTVAKAGIALNMVNPDFQNAYAQDWNLHLEQQITRDTSIMIGFFGSKGTHLRLQDNINQPTNGVLPFPAVVPNATFTCPSVTFPSCKLTTITENDSVGNSNYKALWITGTRRMSHGLQFNASYTLSQSYDYNSLSSGNFLYQQIQNSFDPRGSFGPSDFDARHRFVLSLLWELPLHGNRLLNGWQVSTIFQAQTGNPVSIIANSPAGTNIGTFTNVNNIQPDVIGQILTIGSVNQWFSNATCDPRDTNPAHANYQNCRNGNAVWELPVNAGPGPAVFHFGDYPRNSIIGPGFENVDFSLLKNTKLTERLTFQWRADFFDLFNHPNFSNFTTGLANVAGSANFGRITSTRFPIGDAGSARQIQLAAKILF